MKRKNGIKFIISVVLIFLFAYTLGFGLNLGDYVIKPISNHLKLGLDLKGGVYIEEEVTDAKVDKDTLERAKQLLELRINGLGVSETSIAISGNNKIRIEIPGISDAQAALEQVGKTGKLTFVGGKDDVVITGQDVADSTVGVDPDTQQPVVTLKLTPVGTTKFAEGTKKYLGQQISIKMDEEVISAPVVQVVISNGEAIISGMKDLDEAKRLSGIIKSGALPVTLVPATVKTIGPSLGAEAIPTSARAAAVGIALVMLFMLFYYKIPGLIANLALIVYIMLSLLLFISINATLTLPGIAGFLLSIGMAVDANVLIFERIKEELKKGNSLQTSIKEGFHNALSSILDSNITTLIAGFILYYFGSGTVKGFALTLNVGVICSMFTAITVTKFLLQSFVSAGWVTNTKLYRP